MNERHVQRLRPRQLLRLFGRGRHLNDVSLQAQQLHERHRLILIGIGEQKDRSGM
jgi:hypothetical protein